MKNGAYPDESAQHDAEMSYSRAIFGSLLRLIGRSGFLPEVEYEAVITDDDVKAISEEIIKDFGRVFKSSSEAHLQERQQE